MNQKFRIMGMLAVLLVVGFLVTSCISYLVAHRSLSDQIASSTLPLTSDNIYSEIQRDLLRPIFIASLMAHDTFVRDWALAGEENPEKMVRYLHEIQKRYATVTSFFVSESSHRYYHSSGVLKTVSKDDPQDSWYFQIPAFLNDYQVNIDRDTADLSSMTVFINHKVYDYHGNYMGAIGVGLGMTSVKNLIEKYQKRYGRTIFFTDRQGQVTLVGEEYNGPKNLREIEGLTPYVTQILTSPSTSLSFEEKGRGTMYFNSRLVKDFDWYLVVLEEGTPGEDQIQKSLLINGGISLAITVIVLLIAGVTFSGYQKRLETMATTDRLTGVTTRQMFDFLYQRMLRSARRRGEQISVLIADIDHFKHVNDTYGHPAGDQVLQAVAGTLADMIRGEDQIFRWGGEEFLIILSGCTLEEAVESAERFRENIEKMTLYRGDISLRVTVSIGCAMMHPDENSDSLISRADNALYKAKNSGRNRVEASHI